MTDNFFWPVGYGDANPTLSRVRPFQIAPWLSGETPEHQEIRLVERSGVGIFPPAAPVRSYDCFTGLQHETEDQPFPGDFLKGWTRLPLDPTFARNYMPPAPKRSNSTS